LAISTHPTRQNFVPSGRKAELRVVRDSPPGTRWPDQTRFLPRELTKAMTNCGAESG